jgi:type IV pilus assembly protein PilP
MRTLTLRLSMVLAAVVLLAGCTRGTDDLHQWVAKEKARKGAPLPPLPVVRTFETFIYKDQGKRDPFAPSPQLEQHRVASGPRPDQNRPKQPLEAFALDSLKMVGTIGTGKSLVALIQDPTGVIYRIHDGNYMGQNYGRVTEVSADHVNLVELVPNGQGGWMERKARIALGEQ